MKRSIITLLSCALMLGVSIPASAQFNLKKAAGAVAKTAKALTISDADMAAYVKESVDWMDKNNPVPGPDSPYTIRLKKLTEGLNDVNGIPLNFKVYDVTDVNAFACPDGSVRVFSSLMDIMSDDELLGIIGHEIGHVAKHHSKNAFKQELLTGAVKDAVGAAGGKLAVLSDSQIADLSQNLIGAKYSQKQENEADDCGYDFLVSNGRNPWGMVMAFEKFLDMEQGSDTKASYLSKMFSSHPETKERIKRMSQRATADGFKRPQ